MGQHHLLGARPAVHREKTEPAMRSPEPTSACHCAGVTRVAGDRMHVLTWGAKALAAMGSNRGHRDLGIGMVHLIQNQC